MAEYVDPSEVNYVDPSQVVQAGGGNYVDPNDVVEQEPSLLKKAGNVLAQIPAGVESAGQMVGRGFSDLLSTGVGMLGGQEIADANRTRSKDIYEKAQKETTDTYGDPMTDAAKVTRGVSQGVTMLAPMLVNPAVGWTGIASGAMTGAEERMKAIEAAGGSQELARKGAALDTFANVFTGLIPGMGIVKGALSNWVSGVMSDDALYMYLESQGNKALADKILHFRGLGLDQEGVIDALVGAIGGKISKPSKPGTKADPDNIKANLDMNDRKTLDQEEAQQTTSQKTLYVGEDQVVSDTLGTKVTEDPRITDLARTKQQNEIASSPWEPAQRDMFPLPTNEQLDLGLRTEPDRGGLARMEDLSRERAKEHATYVEGDKGVQSLESQRAAEGGDAGRVEDINIVGAERAIQRAQELSDRLAQERMQEQPDPAREAKDRQELLDLSNQLRKLRDAANNKVRESLGMPPLSDAIDSSLKATMNQIEARGHHLTDEDFRSAVAKMIAKDPSAFSNSKKAEMMRNPRDYITPPLAAKYLGGIEGPASTTRHDPRLLDSYNERTGEFSGIEMLRKIMADEKNRGYKLIMKYIISHMQRMADKGHPMRWALDHHDDGTVRNFTYDRALKQENYAPAHYDSYNHTIWFGLDGLQPRMMLHEALHGLTVRFITMNPNDPRVKAIEYIFESVKNDPIFHTNIEGKPEYGLKNLKEFISEAFSHPRFQLKLMQHTVKGLAGTAKNAMSALAEQVRRLLGMPAGEASNTLDEIMKRVDPVVEANTENMPALAEAMHKKYRAYEGIRELKKYSGQDAHRAKMEEYKREQERLRKIANIPDKAGTEGIEKDATTEKVRDAEDGKAKIIEDTTGVQHIAKDPVVDEALIEKIKGEEDGSDLWALTPGALARAIAAKSTLVMTGYRLMDNAAKRIAFKTKQIIAPVEKTFAKLLQSDAHSEILHDLFMRELKNKRDYTGDELREAGVPQELIIAHFEFRAMMEQLREQQNIALADKGLPPVDRLQSFITSRWSGPWRANILDADGKIVWQVAEHSRSKAKEAIQYIMDRQPNLKADDLTYRQGRERSDSVESAYHDMLKLLDPEDERVKTLQSIYEEYILGKTENVSQQEKHFLTKTGVRGFAGDRPWSKSDARDMFIQQFEYAKNALKWAEYQKAVDKVKPLLQEPSIQESQKNNIAYLKEYSKNHLGFGTMELFNKLDNFVAKALGVSPQTLQSAMGAAKTYFYLTRLGLSVPFTITQFIQPAVTAPAWHSQLSAEGYWHNPIKTTVLGTLVGVEAAMWHYMKVLGANPKMVESLMDSVDKDAARWMEANGIVEINQLADIKKDMRPEAIKQLAMPFEFTIQHSEIIARSIAFMGYVQHLKQSGKFDLDSAKGRAELFQKAEDMTKISMTDYRSTERAMVFERGGLVGDAAATLHSYQINNLFQLWNFGKEFKNGNRAPLMNMMFMQFLAAGLTGMWFVDDLEDAWDNFKKILPHEDYMKYKDVSIKGFILKHMNDFGSYGLVSKLTGTNIHTRMNAADQLPMYPFEPMDMTSVQGLGKSFANMAGNAVPFAGVAGNTAAAALTIPRESTPDRQKWQAAYAAAPAVAQGPMERLPAFNEGAVSKNPNRIGEGRRVRSESEKSLRDFGFRSTAEQRQMDKDYSNSKIEKELDIRMKRASTNATDHILDGNTKKGVTELIKYVDLGGTPDQVLNAIPKAKLKGMTTELQRRAMEAGSGSRASVLKLQRYIQNVGIE